THLKIQVIVERAKMSPCAESVSRSANERSLLVEFSTVVKPYDSS
ncbi:hypothetical protein NPIL_288871, partial [Nephila pilipes]